MLGLRERPLADDPEHARDRLGLRHGQAAAAGHEASGDEDTRTDDGLPAADGHPFSAPALEKLERR